MLWTWAEKQFLFFPEPEVASTPAQAGLRFEDVYLTASDGTNLHGWFLPAPHDASGPETQTWLWFHGNGGNLGTRVGQLERAHRLLGVHQFIFDYRGYGNSEGSPSERGTYLTLALRCITSGSGPIWTPAGLFTSGTRWGRR